MRYRRIWAAVLALCLLTGCGNEAALPEVTEAASGVIAYVPLDDRPVNTDRVVYLGQSLGYEMALPGAALYHTCLDGQPRNPNGTPFGDRAALFDWVLEQERGGCEQYILSLDQLLSGGLVASRELGGGGAVAVNGAEKTEGQLLEALLGVLCSDENNQIFLLDTVMRLAPTVGSGGVDLARYEALRSYGMAERPTLSGQRLTVGNIVAGYGFGADRKAVKTDLPAAVLTQYLAARERKLRLTAEALTLTEGLENVHFLIGVDDSAPANSIQTNEIAYLKQAVAGRGAVLSGADEDGMLALCRLYADTAPALPTAWVRYFGGGEQRASSDYDHQPLTEIVAAHLDYLGVGQVEGASASLQVLVLTRPEKDGEKQRYIRDLVAALRENEKNGVPTILLDAAKNELGADAQTQLVKKIQLGALLGYAGYYDLANVTGIALSNGVARWLRLSSGDTRGTAQEQAFLRTLADSLLKDICYKNDAKIAMTTYVRQDLSGDPDNFAKTGIDENAVGQRLETEMLRATKAVVNNLQHSNFLTSLKGESCGWGTVALSNFHYPWQRVFELRMHLTLGAFTTPHSKSLFG